MLINEGWNEALCNKGWRRVLCNEGWREVLCMEGPAKAAPIDADLECHVECHRAAMTPTDNIKTPIA